jgi:hypothetical protein
MSRFTSRFAASLLTVSVSILITILGGHVAFADDMDFGGVEPEQVKKGAPSLEDAPAPSQTGVTDSTSTTSIGSSSVSRSSSKWSEFKRNLGFGFFNYSNVVASEVNRGKGYLSTYNYLSMEYRLGRGEKIFFRPAFLFNSEGQNLRNQNSSSEFAWSDAYFGYASYNLPWLPFEMDYKSEFRVYIPTSENAQNSGMIARLRGDLKAHYPLTSRLTFLLWFKPDYFIQRRTAYSNGRYVNGTKDYGYELSANLYYQLRGEVWGLGSSIQHEQFWTHASETENLTVYRREDISAQVFVGVNAFGFFTHVGVDQTRNVSSPRDSLVALRDTETQYFARSYYRF